MERDRQKKIDVVYVTSVDTEETLHNAVTKTPSIQIRPENTQKSQPNESDETPTVETTVSLKTYPKEETDLDLTDEYCITTLEQDPLHVAIIATDPQATLEAYFQQLERYRFNEQHITSDFKNTSSTHITTQHLSAIESRTRRERVTDVESRLQEAIQKERIGERNLLKTILDEGEWRETIQSQGKIHDLIQDTHRTKEEYDTKQELVYDLVQTYDGGGTLKYCEGVSLPKYGGIPQRHAWAEIDSKVIELLWPWSGPQPAPNSAYYGLSIPLEYAGEYLVENGYQTALPVNIPTQEKEE